MKDPIISVHNFSKSFGRVKVIHNLNFEVERGEIFAFLGANGSGKTTTIRNLLGIQQPDTGTLQINGQKYSTENSNILGYLPEERGLYTAAKALEMLIYFGTLKGMTSSEARTAALDYLERVELLEKADTEIKRLSSGQQQKIQLGITLINTPELLILDEPWKGLDPVNRGLLANTLTEMNKRGTTIMFSTHQMEDAEKLAHRLLLLKEGEAKLYGELNEVKSRFGENTIHLKFKGELNRNNELFTIKSDTTNTAELIPHEGIASENVLRFLVESGMQILKYELSSPSLQEIFIKVSKDETE